MKNSIKKVSRAVVLLLKKILFRPSYRFEVCCIRPRPKVESQ